MITTNRKSILLILCLTLFLIPMQANAQEYRTWTDDTPFGQFITSVNENVYRTMTIEMPTIDDLEIEPSNPLMQIIIDRATLLSINSVAVVETDQNTDPTVNIKVSCDIEDIQNQTFTKLLDMQFGEVVINEEFSPGESHRFEITVTNNFIPTGDSDKIGAHVIFYWGIVYHETLSIPAILIFSSGFVLILLIFIKKRRK